MTIRTLFVIALTLSCKGKDDADDNKQADPGYQPEVFCPGGDGCANADGPLMVGVARASVIPDCWETWTDIDGDYEYHSGDGDTFDDCGCDQECGTNDEGEGDGEFQTAWLAGFNNARAAQGVRGKDLGTRGEGDGLFASVIVLEKGDTRVGIVSLDAVGWMHDQVLGFREAVGDDVDFLIIHSSHGHEGPDTMGIWGPGLTTTGYQDRYFQQTKDVIVKAVKDAVADLVEVDMYAGTVDSSTYHPAGTANLITDTRDPWIVDPAINVAHFTEAGSDKAVATLVNWANHPETVADDNGLMTSDYAHALRMTVEEGVEWNAFSQDGVGGQAILINGTVGGMMTSLRGTVEDPDGGMWQSASWEKADAVGQLAGGMALDAIEAAEKVEDPQLKFGSRSFFMPIDNLGFQAMFLSGVLDHRTPYNYDPDLPLQEGNIPDVKSEVAILDLGPIRMVTVPGEMLPELAIGGYDGAFTPKGVDIFEADNPNPPDLDAAPEGPYLKDLMGAEHNWVMGLGNDQVGYIVPEYNFKVDPVAPYIFEVDGDHYEETNSLGPETGARVIEQLQVLIDWADGNPVTEPERGSESADAR